MADSGRLRKGPIMEVPKALTLNHIVLRGIHFPDLSPIEIVPFESLAPNVKTNLAADRSVTSSSGAMSVGTSWPGTSGGGRLCRKILELTDPE